MGPSHSSSLRIGDDPSADAGFGRARDVPVRSTAAGPQNAPEALSRPDSRPDPIGGSEPVSGTRDSGLGLFT